MVKPTQRKGVVTYLRSAYAMSQRKACRLAKISRKAVTYRPKPCHDDVIQRRLKQLGEQYPRYGYLMLHALPARANERWSLDFVHDQLADGRRMRVLNIVDDYSRVCVGQLVDTSISGLRLTRYLDELAATRSLPKFIVMDNGPELTSKAMFFWSQRTGVKLHFIQPGKPTQNAFVESFNARFREHCLNQHWFKDLFDAKRIITAWRHHYNTVRPHSSLGYQTPKLYELQAA